MMFPASVAALPGIPALPALCGALAFAVLTLALSRLFGARHGASLGRLRAPILALASGQVVLQVLVAGALLYGRPGIREAAALAAGFGQLALGAMFWPFLRGLHGRVSNALGRQARARLEVAEQEVGEAHAWLDMAEQVAQFGHWRIRLADRVLEWSDEMYRIHGLSYAEFSPAIESVMALFHPEDRKTVSGSIAVALAEGGSFEVRVRLHRPDRELRHVILRGQTQSAQPSQAQSAQPNQAQSAQPNNAQGIARGNASVVGVMVDITAQKQAEARMREANMVALQANAALKEMSLEDELTGISNRRQFDLSLVHEFKRALRSATPLGLLLIDLDHFQAFNEQYGEAAGDACLRRVAQAISTVPRRTGDLVARYASEEIAVLLPLADHAGVERVASMLQDAVRALRIPHAGSETGYVTLSCGAAAFTGVRDFGSPLELVRRADHALYKAKTEGRDRIIRFDPVFNPETQSPYGMPVNQDAERFIKSRG